MECPLTQLAPVVYRPNPTPRGLVLRGLQVPPKALDLQHERKRRRAPGRRNTHQEVRLITMVYAEELIRDGQIHPFVPGIERDPPTLRGLFQTEGNALLPCFGIRDHMP